MTTVLCFYCMIINNSFCFDCAKEKLAELPLEVASAAHLRFSQARQKPGWTRAQLDKSLSNCLPLRRWKVCPLSHVFLITCVPCHHTHPPLPCHQEVVRSLDAHGLAVELRRQALPAQEQAALETDGTGDLTRTYLANRGPVGSTGPP